MNIDVAKLEVRAEVLRVRMAALRAHLPNPEGDLKILLELMYGLAGDAIAAVELIADVTADVDRAIQNTEDDAKRR